MPKITPGETDFIEAMRVARMVHEDLAFQDAMLFAHPDIYVGVRTEPCTDNPQPMAPVVVFRAGPGFNWPRGE